MKYSNQQLPEGINTSKGHPLRIFLKLFLAVAIILFVLAWILGRSGAWLAMLIPFEKEYSLFHELETVEIRQSAMQDYLQGLANQLVQDMEMPEYFKIQVHYDSDTTINAFATLGGHVFFYRGLLEKLPNENALAMLIAHEMAHVKHRDPIASIGQGLAIQTGIGLILGQVSTNALGTAGVVTQLKFSRDMESAADTQALEAVYQRYGTLAGALDLYEVFLQESGSNRAYGQKFFNTHPLTRDRISRLQSMADERGWSREGEPTSLPEQLRSWLLEANSH